MATPDETPEAAISTPTKRCSGCHREVTLALFTKKSQAKDGLESRCITCRAHDRRRSNYDLTPEDYLKMLFLQDARCAVCRTPMNELDRGLMVDHRHSDGLVRGLLCTHCNTGLGMMKDDPDMLRRAAQYLELWEN